MISFSRLTKMGRTANVLFQISAANGLAEKKNTIASFPHWQYEDKFEEPLHHGQMQSTIYKEPSYEYMEVDEDNVDLQGYFQSEKYFPTKSKIRFKESFLNEMRQRMPAGEKIAVHIRRSDYVGHEAYYQLPITYFIQALFSITDWQSKQIIFFSEDLGYCRTHFECLSQAHFIKGNEIEHLAMMSLCDHHILSNSSYSWWGAYLSEQKNVIYPSEYFRGSYANKSTRDLWPENWHKFDVTKDMRLDCSDMTFTIPVNHDHHDRKKNLDLALCHLQKYIKAEYIVGECLSDSFGYMKEYAKYIRFDYSEFHRTKMLNQMAEMATTPFIANWDCDVFIPPLQIWLTCEKLRNGGQMVYPYDGRFARMDRLPWFKRVEQYVDIGVTSDEQLSGRAVKESVGGAVCWNKEAFTEYGCENEYMISYAPEDVERYERAFKLGCKIEKVGGVLYHMDHFKGPDSSNRSTHFPKSKALLEQYRAMTADELRKETDRWPWRNQYTAQYYDRINEESNLSRDQVFAFFEQEKFKPKTVIDIGSGAGAWLKGIEKFGVMDYLAVDNNVSEKSLLIPKDKFLKFDLEAQTELISGEYDLAICVEVAEHLSKKSAIPLIKMLCSLSDTVLFSAAIKDQGGTGHINEQPASYWAAIFSEFRYYPYRKDIRKYLFYNRDCAIWYRNNLVIYVKGHNECDYPIDFVHPEMFDNCILHHKNQIQELSDRCASLQKHLASYK